MLVSVLVVNMLLLLPQLHAPDGGGWHLVGFKPTTGDRAAAAADPGAAAGKTIKASSLQQVQQMRSASSIATGEFVAAFDANKDGVLGPAEFNVLVRVSRQHQGARHEQQQPPVKNPLQP